MTVTVEMLRRMRLNNNLEKTKSIVCTPGFICGKWGEKAYKRRAKGEGDNFREMKRTQVSCTECDVTVAASYIKKHMARMHGICVSVFK